MAAQVFNDIEKVLLRQWLMEELHNRPKLRRLERDGYLVLGGIVGYCLGLASALAFWVN